MTTPAIGAIWMTCQATEINMQRTCAKCKANPARRVRGRSQGYCKQCHAEYNRGRYKADKQSILESNRAWANSQRGRCARALHNTKVAAKSRGYKPCPATVEEVEAALESQGHCCAICGFSAKRQGNRNLSLDHCHETGKFRGWLCWVCNSYLSRIDEQPTALVEYLRG